MKESISCVHLLLCSGAPASLPSVNSVFEVASEKSL